MDCREVSVELFSSSSGGAVGKILVRVVVIPCSRRGMRRNSTCHDWLVTAGVEQKFAVQMRIVLWSVSVVDIVIAVTAVMVEI